MTAVEIVPTRVDIARQAWAGSPPDWVAALAAEVDRTSGKEAAKRVGISGSTVSDVIRNSYGAGLAGVEAKVRASLMRDQVECPVLGAISGAVCAGHQRAEYRSANPLRIQLFRACRNGCAHSSIRKDKT